MYLFHVGDSILQFCDDPLNRFLLFSIGLLMLYIYIHSDDICVHVHVSGTQPLYTASTLHLGEHGVYASGCVGCPPLSAVSQPAQTATQT